MSRIVRSSTYARIKMFNGVLFMLCGIAVVVQVALSIGLHAQAIPAYVLGFAFIGLGIVRLRSGWKSRA